jgi:hypothetical protein
VSYETDLDTAFTILLGKAQGTITQAGPPVSGGGTTVYVQNPATINFGFSGGSSALTTGSVTPFLVEVPFAAHIVWVHMYAGDAAGAPVAVSAVVELHVTSLDAFGGSSNLWGTGSPATMTSASHVDISLSGWQLDLDAGDTLIARLASFTGTAEWLALTMQLKPTTTPVFGAVQDSSNAALTSDNGTPVQVGPGPF